MMPKLDQFSSNLSGRVLDEIENIHDALWLRFTDSTTLSIMNPARLTADFAKVALGCKITGVIDAGEEVRILFENSSMIIVDVSEAGYIGPEAMVLTTAQGLTVVWQ